jgi:hypothetical protein
VFAGKIPMVSHKLNFVCEDFRSHRDWNFGVAFMQSKTISARKRALARVVVLSVAGVAGMFTGWSVGAQTSELTPAQVVNFRFPSNWGVAAASPRPAAIVSPRSADGSADRSRAVENQPPPPAPKGDRQIASVIFDPTPTYQLASAVAAPVREELPVQVAAYSDPAADRAPFVRAAVERSTVAPARPAPAKTSSAFLNEAQISSIKSRLRLTSDQQRHWPAVEAALRNIAHKKNAARAGASGGSRTPSIDPNSTEVAQLKSAAIPLVLSMSYEQKREVRNLAHLMGLESVVAQF